jgi:hypothetical protein
LSSTAGVVDSQPEALAAKLTADRAPSEMSLGSPRAIVGLVTLLGIGLRVLAVRGFSFAEATSGYEARLPLSQLTHALVRSTTAPFNLALLWAVAHAIGSTEFDLRLPSLLFGAVTIPMLYLAGRALYSEGVGMLAALLGAIGALGIWYAQDAGAGALAMLLAVTTIWAVRRALSTDRRRYWLAWAAAAVGLIWAQWSGAMVVAVEVAAIALAFVGQADSPGGAIGRGRPRRRAQRPLAAIAVVAAAAVLAGPFLLAQAHHSAIPGLGGGMQPSQVQAGVSAAGTLGLLAQLAWGFHGDGVIADIVALWPLLIVGMLLLLGRTRHPAHCLLLGIIVVPLAAGAGTAALSNRDALQVSNLVEIVPAIYLVVAGAIGTAPRTWLGRRTFAIVTLVVMASGLLLQQTDTANPELYGYRAAFGQISSAATRHAWVAYAPADLDRVVGYFAPSMRAIALDAAPDAVPAGAQVFVVGSAGATPAAGAAERSALRALRNGRHLVAVFHAPHVVVWELS